MKTRPALISSVITLTAAILSAALFMAIRPTDTTAPIPTGAPTLLPLASDMPGTNRSPLQAAAFAQFTGMFGTARPSVVPPVSDFLNRITKKPFGIFITPDTSPVDNDRFTGYHAGIDVEFTDTNEEVPVYAIADGTIVTRSWIKGYGGVIIIRHTLNGVPVYALYGHLDQASFLPTQMTQVAAGQQIARLGDDHSQETDGVRKHLHFSIFPADKIDFRGYVQTEEELTRWLNPLDFYSL